MTYNYGMIRNTKNKLEVRFDFKLSVAMYNEILNRCENSGCSLAAWVRRAIQAALDAGKTEIPGR